jgi:FkbM family methyltransferase
MQRKNHHSVFGAYDQWSGAVDAGFQVNFLGVRTRIGFTNKAVTTEYPAFDEEYFEWIDLLEAVADAHGRFTMIELGAGRGRWLVNAAVALRQRKPMTIPFIIGVEAEPTHFEQMKIHFRDNNLDPDKHLLIQAAVAAKDGHARFFTGYSLGWEGQSIVPSSWKNGWRIEKYPNAKIEKVKAISLKSILRPLKFVDLIDLDIQGQEYEVLKAAASDVNEKVARVHIGTHDKETLGTLGKDVEKGLREIFNSMGWSNICDYPAQNKSVTPYGEISFVDGVQTWLNPKLR